MEAVRRIRTMRGMNQIDLANASGVAQNTISEIELGKRKARPATLKKLADALGVEVVDLFPKKAPGRSSLEPSLNDVLEEERRADVKGPDKSAWGAPQNRPGPEEQIPESAGQRIHVEIRDDLSTEPARVTISRTAFLDMLRRHGLREPEAEEVIEELQRRSA